MLISSVLLLLQTVLDTCFADGISVLAWRNMYNQVLQGSLPHGARRTIISVHIKYVKTRCDTAYLRSHQPLLTTRPRPSPGRAPDTQGVCLEFGRCGTGLLESHARALFDQKR
jgi:hypothetical protein